MKLNQLIYVREIVRNRFNITATAESLFTSQPGISKQISQLEDELGVRLFARRGRLLTGLTPPGEAILEQIEHLLAGVENIRRLASDSVAPHRGSLSIATTHTQARYRLPPVVERFIRQYPEVSLHLHQGTPTQIARLAADGNVDFAIATEAMELFEELVMMPCYRWNRSIIVPAGHPLIERQTLTLQEVARHPIVTYVFGFTGRSQLDAAFHAAGLKPDVVFTAVDADVIKTYVRLGLGIGITASMAFDPAADHGLVSLPADRLFEDSITWIGCRRDLILRRYMYDFIGLFAPHLTRERIERSLQAATRAQRAALFKDLELPRL